MATKARYGWDEIRKGQYFTRLRTTIETAFHGNNVETIKSLKQAYEYAKQEQGVIILDMPIHKPKALGLPAGAKVLLTNGGKTVGRYAKARVILNDDPIARETYCDIARAAIWAGREQTFLAATAIIGLGKEFTAKAHLMIPKAHASLMYSWLLNFEFFSEKLRAFYDSSDFYPEGDIYVYADPEYVVEGHEEGLALFDPKQNCAMILGMSYFGELKKGSLTLAWGLASRHGFVACHGGMKQYRLPNQTPYTIGVFGLSGSGKSTLTHEKHGGKYDISVLHDDAYVIRMSDGASIAMEPTYFDKTQDYPMGDPSNKYLLTVQNCGVTLDENDKKVLVTEDVRNGNGRAIKSPFWTDNRVNVIREPVNAIVWIMKDNKLPPILKIKNPILAATMGATLATKRTTAEKVDADVDRSALVIEPYANPFRTYPLGEDYEHFKELFENGNVDCYILNTGDFMEADIPKTVTLSILEGLVNNSLTFEPFLGLADIETVLINKFGISSSTTYKVALKNSMETRLAFIQGLRSSVNELPISSEEVLEKVIQSLEEQINA